MVVTNYKRFPKEVKKNMTGMYFDIRYINILRKFLDKHCNRDDVIVPFRDFNSENGTSRVGLLVHEISSYVTIAQEMGMSFAEITSKECDKFYEKKHCLSVNEMKVLTIIKAKYVVRARSARISLSLIHLLRVLTRITYTTHDSHPYHPSFARIPREYSIFNTRTPTLEHRYLPTWIVGKGEAEAYVLYFNYITFLCYTHSNYNTGTRAVVR